MYDYIMYTDNSLKYTLSGIDIHNVIEDNLHIIKHICGNKTDILFWEIEENTFKMVKSEIPLALDNGQFTTYIIYVKYNLKTTRYTKFDNDIKLMKIYVEEHPHINLPWEIMRL